MDNEQLYFFVKKAGKTKRTPLRRIRDYCKWQCSAGNSDAWKNCQFTACLLHCFRAGRQTLPKSFLGSEKGTSTHKELKKEHSTRGDKNANT